MRTTPALSALLLLCALGLPACGEDDRSPLEQEVGSEDAGVTPPPGTDGGGVPVTDGGTQAGRDAGVQPRPDGGTQPPRDAGVQPPTDAGTPDAGTTPPRDAGVQPPVDAGTPPQDGGTSTPGDGGVTLYGPTYSGLLYLGPVEWTGSYHNACSPYPAEVQATMGGLLVGISNAIPETASLCDACVSIDVTGTGRRALARVVTYGDTTGAGYLDTSRRLYDQLVEPAKNSTPPISWRVAKCPDTGPVRYQFQTASHQDWTSFWVRDARLPLAKVEVRSSKNPTWTALRRETDGTFNDDDGIGLGAFSIRLTAIDGQQLVDDFPSYTRGYQLLPGKGNFQ